MEVEIINRDLWFKVVEFLQQNWALIDKCEVDKRCNVFFINDASGAFDKIQFSSFAEAQEGLRKMALNAIQKIRNHRNSLLRQNRLFVKPHTLMAQFTHQEGSGNNEFLARCYPE